MPVTILVLGGTGNVGRHLVRFLLEQRQSVRVLVRSADRAALVPPNAAASVVDVVGDPDGARAAFQGVDAVFMLNAVTTYETVEGLMLVAMAKAAGVQRFVYQSTHSLGHLHHLPHLGSKLAIEEALKASGMAYTIISPNHFFQNDEYSRIALLQHGVYLNPIGDVGCWRVDVRDIAEAAAKIVTSEGHAGKNYALVGPENLTGPQCTETWARALGRPIHYEADVSQWQSVVKPYLAAWLVEDLGFMFEEIIEHGMLGNADELAAVTKLLGRPPRRHADYVAECVAQWRESTGQQPTAG
jgi:uncharacterized protein YbjT (DUF2867 family)